MKILLLLCIFEIFVNIGESVNLESKLKNGQRLGSRSEPFHKSIASIFYENDYNLKCVATVVSINQLLTLAKCIKTPIVQDSVEELDRYHAKIAFYDELRASYKHKFLQVEVHPAYDLRHNFDFCNLGLITLIKPIQIDAVETFAPIESIPLNTDPKQNEFDYVPGFENMSQSTPNGPPMFGIKYALLKRRPMYTYRGDITLRETGHHAGLFYAVVSNGLTNVGRLETRDLGAPILTKAGFSMSGILTRLLGNKGNKGLFIETHKYRDWINAAKNNEALPGHGRLFFNGNGPHQPLPILQL